MILGTSFLIYEVNGRDSKLNIDRDSKPANNYSCSYCIFGRTKEIP